MKKYLFTSFLSAIFYFNEFSQNLVPNPGFENTNNVYCGIFGVNDLSNSTQNWINPTAGTPDLYSTQINQSCYNFMPNSTYPGPIGIKGIQLPRTGNVFAGFFAYTVNGLNQREYLQVQLSQPLLIGQTYCVEFYLSLANYTEYSIEKIGALLTNNPVTGLNDQPLNYVPQIESQIFVADTMNWVKISGVIQPTVNLNYLTIGNFNNDAATTTSVNPGGGLCVSCYGAYYYLDDISITNCSTQLNELSNFIQINHYPNPFTNKLFFKSNDFELKTLYIYDALMNKIFAKEFENETEILTSDLKSGLYLYQIKTKNGFFLQGKVIKD